MSEVGCDIQIQTGLKQTLDAQSLPNWVEAGRVWVIENQNYPGDGYPCCTAVSPDSNRSMLYTINRKLLSGSLEIYAINRSDKSLPLVQREPQNNGDLHSTIEAEKRIFLGNCSLQQITNKQYLNNHYWMRNYEYFVMTGQSGPRAAKVLELANAFWGPGYQKRLINQKANAQRIVVDSILQDVNLRSYRSVESIERGMISILSRYVKGITPINFYEVMDYFINYISGQDVPDDKVKLTPGPENERPGLFRFRFYDNLRTKLVEPFYVENKPVVIPPVPRKNVPTQIVDRNKPAIISKPPEKKIEPVNKKRQKIDRVRERKPGPEKSLEPQDSVFRIEFRPGLNPYEIGNILLRPGSKITIYFPELRNPQTGQEHSMEIDYQNRQNGDVRIMERGNPDSRWTYLKKRTPKQTFEIEPENIAINGSVGNTDKLPYVSVYRPYDLERYLQLEPGYLLVVSLREYIALHNIRQSENIRVDVESGGVILTTGVGLANRVIISQSGDQFTVTGAYPIIDQSDPDNSQNPIKSRDYYLKQKKLFTLSVPD